MKSRLWFVSSAVVSLLGLNALMMMAQAGIALPGSVADWNELSQIRGEGLPGTECKPMVGGAPCTAAVPPASAAATGCGILNANRICATVAGNTVGAICAGCAGADERCNTYAGARICGMSAFNTGPCCESNTCAMITAGIPAVTTCVCNNSFTLPNGTKAYDCF